MRWIIIGLVIDIGEEDEYIKEKQLLSLNFEDYVKKELKWVFLCRTLDVLLILSNLVFLLLKEVFLCYLGMQIYPR